MLRHFLPLAAVAMFASSATAQPAASIIPLVADARDMAVSTGEQLWPGYGSAPFGLLLVEDASETLLCQHATGFEPIGTDPATGCEVSRRLPSGLPTGVMAAMPIFGPPWTIVVGTPEATGLSPAGWTLTVLHEHFHQWQSALPGYYERVAALDLADGDETGMWMLNFPVPYMDPDVAAAHAHASMALRAALDRRGTPGFVEAVYAYLVARAAFAASMDTRSWRYLDFQFWQEGVARWTEIEIGLQQGEDEARSVATRRRDGVLSELLRPDIATSKRSFVYAYGAGEAMLLEACDPSWRLQYAFDLGLDLRWQQAACVQSRAKP